MTYDSRSIQPGNYKGQADTFALRYILQYSKTKEEAVAYLQSIPRTWAMWIGVGDFASQELNLVGYKEESATAYTGKFEFEEVITMYGFYHVPCLVVHQTYSIYLLLPYNISLPFHITTILILINQ